MSFYQQLGTVIVMLVTVDCVISAPKRPADTFASAVELFTANDPVGARNTLREIPDAELIRSGIAFLRQNPTLPKEARQFCYEVLAKRGAARSEDGYDLLIDGLLEPMVRRWAVAGLEDVPVERRVETVEHLVTIGRKVSAEEPNNLIMLSLGMLARWGDAASKAVPEIAEIFHGPTYPPQYRSLAASTLLSVAPPEIAVEHFEQEDVALSIGAIGAAGYESNGTFGTDEQSIRARLRRLVLNALQSADLKIRSHALEALLPAYGVDFLVADGQGGFRANPEVVEALEALAANETDASLRARAQSGLDTLDERVRKAIRRRNKRAKSAESDGD